MGVNPASIANNAPRGPDWIVKKIQDMEQTMRENAAARTLEAAEIGAGGLSINGGSLTVKGGGDVTIEDDGNLNVAGDTVISGTLGVSGDATFSGDLGVSGTATLDGDLDVIGDGKIVINPGSGKTSIQVDVNAAKDRGEIVFHSQFGDPGEPANVTLVDPGGSDSYLLLRSPQKTNSVGDQTQLYLTPEVVVVEIGKGADMAAADYCLITLGQDASYFQFPTGTVGMRSNAVDLGSSVGVLGTGSEVRVVQVFTTTTYVPIRASSFPVGSSREIKQDINEIGFDSLAAIKDAPVRSWRYRPEHATDPMTHIGPMAEDLPAELTHTDEDGVLSVDLLSMIGTLWDANAKLLARVELLEAAAGI